MTSFFPKDILLLSPCASAAMRRFVAVAWPRAAAAGAATARRACPGPAAVHVVCGSTQRHRATTAHALVEEYVTKGVLHPDDIEASYLGTLAKLPPGQAIEAVREFVKEAGGAAARELSPAERRDVMDVILQPYLEAEASAKWEWRDYDRKQHTVNIEKRFANRGAPPSNEYITMMDPTVEPETLVPSHFETVTLTMVGFDYSLLDSYVELIQRAGGECDINMSGRVPLPTRIEKYTVLKSPHVHKKHRSQYETRSHRRLVQFHNMSGPTASAFLDYVVRLCPPGVELRLAHTTIEAPSGELAKALGWQPVPDTSALSHEIRRVLQPAEIGVLLDAMRAHASGGGAEAFRVVPQSVFKHVRLTAGLREFVADTDRAKFDSIVDDALSGRAPPPPPPPPPAPSATHPSPNVASTPQDTCSDTTSASVTGDVAPHDVPASGDSDDEDSVLEVLTLSIEELGLLTREELDALSHEELQELTEAARSAASEGRVVTSLEDLDTPAGIAAKLKSVQLDDGDDNDYFDEEGVRTPVLKGEKKKRKEKKKKE